MLIKTSKNCNFFSFLRKIQKHIQTGNFPYSTHIEKVYQDNDEPQIKQYLSIINPNSLITDGFKTSVVCTGSSLFSNEEALTKSLMETIERAASMTYLNKDLQTMTIQQALKNNYIQTLNPLNYSYFSDEQIQNDSFSKFKFSNKTKFSWIIGNNLSTKEKVYIPAQLVYFNYRFQKNEGRMLIPISTGTATGLTPEEAIIRGIFEVVERDSFMIFYLNKLQGKLVEINKTSDNIEEVQSISSRYRLKTIFLDITSDLGIPTILTILLNQTEIGPTISLGLKTDFDIEKALVGSFLESFHARNWLRHKYEDRMSRKEQIKINPKHINNIEQRGLYWYSKNMIKNLSFWVDGTFKKTKIIGDKKQYKLQDILTIFQKKNYPVYAVNLTNNYAKKLGVFVYKAIIPTLQPFYLDEQYPYFGGERLDQVPQMLGYEKNKNLNKIPHPFL